MELLLIILLIIIGLLSFLLLKKERVFGISIDNNKNKDQVKIIESKEEFKELIKNTKIKFDKVLYNNNEYSKYNISNNVITETKNPYKPFVFEYYKPNVVFNIKDFRKI